VSPEHPAVSAAAETLRAIAERIDMVDLSLAGIEAAVALLMGRRA